MRRFLAAFLLAGCTARPIQHASFDPAILRQIDARIEQAIADQKTPGGVYHLEQGSTIYEKAYGNRALVPFVEPMTIDTIFDAASITKVVATTPAIWLLIQRGKISIDDSVQKFVPEFPRADITIRHLLTHTSGLRPDLDLKDPWSGYDTAMQLIMKEEPVNNPGYVFRYSDINFELLGEIVRRVSAEPLDVFCRKEIFQPLGMSDTGFRPLTPTSPTLSPGEGRVRGASLQPNSPRESCFAASSMIPPRGGWVGYRDTRDCSSPRTIWRSIAGCCCAAARRSSHLLLSTY